LSTRGPDITCDVVIIGGGPSGATAALALARAGLKALVIEKAAFPRFHVGESFLPSNFELIRALGLEPELRKLPHVVKFGAEFAFGYGEETTRFCFDEGLDGSDNETFNIARAPFDAMVLREARKAGAEVLEEMAVRRVLHLEDGHAEVELSDGRRVKGQFLFDASGQATFLGRHFGRRRGFAHHRKVAYFGHFEDVARLSGREAGYPTVVMCDEGWFWLIPIDEKRTSIGLVMDVDKARLVNAEPHEMLFWGIRWCPLLRERTAEAVYPARNHVIADFSYTCAPYAGPGYFLIGDAAIFLDPIFSTGICLGMKGALEATEAVVGLLSGRVRAAAVRRRYGRLVKRWSSVFFRLVELYHRHAFRELFMHGQGPIQVNRAVISVLAGHVFPRPAWSLRWRLWAFEWMIRVQQHFALVPRRRSFSLLAEAGRGAAEGADRASGEALATTPAEALG